MNSESNSDDSHVSATPPKRLLQPLFQRQPTPPSLLSSEKSVSKLNTASSLSVRAAHVAKPKSLKPKASFCPIRSKPAVRRLFAEPPPSFIQTPDYSPIHIIRPTDQIRDLNHPLDKIPADHFSMSSASENLKCPILQGPIENYPNEYSTPTPQSGIEIGSTTSYDFVMSCNAKPTGTVKNLPNLIGRFYNVPLESNIRPKHDNNGNFKKYNLKFNRKKYANKRSLNSYTSSTRKSNYRRSKRKLNADPEKVINSFCNEDGSVLEEEFQSPRDENLDFECELIEKALLSVRSEASHENLVNLLKLTHHYDSFRDGQFEAIKMVLSGNSTMLVLPTGAGKSLCYQLPAIILQGITVVVSPLVSLMIDQHKQLPPMVSGRILSSFENFEESAETKRLLREGVIKVLFVSPERFMNEDFLSLFSSTLPISLVVVDEAHCVSEWSHNFRPAYMRLRASLLRDRLNINCILAMTATATRRTLHTVMSALEIPATNIIHRALLTENQQLSVSLIGNCQRRMKDILTLIKSPPFTEMKSIIIYCKFKDETETISKYLCDNNIPAMSYHSAFLPKERRRTQELFCSNKIRVVVATVAFGMGLDKKDIGTVIHYSLPESLEHYVQEIGRAGRDGRLSYCHLFLDNITYFRLRSLMHSDGVDECAVSRFLFDVFSHGIDSRGKICSLIIEPSCRKFDMNEEVMLTLLTRLELDEVQYLRLLPKIEATCTLYFHKTAAALLAKKDIMVSTILNKSESTKNGMKVFHIPSIANSIGITASDLLNQLHNLKVKGEITYELKDPAYCYTIVDVPGDICSLAAHITEWLSDVERCKVRKLDAMFDAVSSSIAKSEKTDGCDGAEHTFTSCMQKRIMDYFSEDDCGDVPNIMSETSGFLKADIKVFLKSYKENKFSPRAVARIMHGISSPAYPQKNWSKCHFWERYRTIDFQVVMAAAKAELMDFAGRNM